MKRYRLPYHRRATTEFWPGALRYAADTATWLAELKARFDQVSAALKRVDPLDTKALEAVLKETYEVEEELKTVIDRNLYEFTLAIEQHVEELEDDETY